MATLEDRKREGSGTLGWVLHGVGHVVGVVALAFVMMWMVGLNLHEVELILSDEQMRAQSGGEFVQLMLAALACWCLGWGAWRVMKHVVGMQSSGPKRIRVRGQVMLETLIVIPVLLTLVLGSVQFALRMTAGMLTTLGAYQAGRAASVWYPETEVDRRSAVTSAMVTDKARLAAATSVVPAAPGNFVGINACSDTSSSASFERLSDAMEAGVAFEFISGSVSGFTKQKFTGMRRNLKLSYAFDSLSMRGRVVKKLQSAYCHMEVDPFDVDGDRNITTRIRYHHQAVVPIAEVLFGSLEERHGMIGYYKPIERVYKTRLQMVPNPNDPL